MCTPLNCLSCCGYSLKSPQRNEKIYPLVIIKIEPPHDKTNKMACVPSEDSDQPGHPPKLIRVFALRVKKAWVLSYPLSASKDWSDWVDAQADLSLRWAHSHFAGFVVRRLKYLPYLFLWVFTKKIDVNKMFSNKNANWWASMEFEAGCGKT